MFSLATVERFVDLYILLFPVCVPVIIIMHE